MINDEWESRQGIVEAVNEFLLIIWINAKGVIWCQPNRASHLQLSVVISAIESK